MPKNDHRLISIAAENARMRLNTISASLKKSSQRLTYAIAALERDRILHTPHCIFDYSHFGLLLFRVYFKGAYVSEADKEYILSAFKANPYIVSAYELNGEFDLVIEMEVPNPSRFNKEFKKLVSTIPPLDNYKILLNVVTHIYLRAYISERQETFFPDIQQSIVIGGDRPSETFREQEMKLMGALNQDPLIRQTALAKKTDVTIKTAASMLKNLTSRKCIRGFHYIVDTTKLGIFKHRVFIKLHNLTQEKEAKLMEHLLNTPEIMLAHKTVGDWDLEIDIASLNQARIRQVVRTLREEFKELIQSFNMMELYQYYTRAYLPSFLFSENSSKPL